MSFFAQLNTPPLVAAAAGALAVGLPAATTLAGTASPGLLQAANVIAYALNCAAVSVPGRIDSQAQDELQGTGTAKKSDGDGDKKKEDDATYQNVYSPSQGRSLITPAGWAFAIWGPIYAGEAVFCGAQFLSSSPEVMAVLPAVTAPFVAANLFQSLWCASFRPSYVKNNNGSSTTWQKYVSVAMLGGTAFCLSQVHAAAAASSWLFVPLTMHFGWTTAATLVNLNGSVAASDTASDQTVIGVGHASTIAATLLGVTVTLAQSSPAYGLTVAWALAACSDGMKKRQQKQQQQGSAAAVSETITRGMKVQQTLCLIGSGLCAATAVATMIL